MVNVTILDINDNCPMFVNLPYYAVVSVDAQKGDVITKVRERFCYESEDV
jgi:protocadherin Fat 1/2/3